MCHYPVNFDIMYLNQAVNRINQETLIWRQDDTNILGQTKIE